MQPDLFGSPPRARRSDPESSHIAAREHHRSGATAHQQRQTIAAVRQWPGSTSRELAQHAQMDRYALARRLPECERDGAVVKGPMRECAISGRPCVTWWPA